MDTLEWLNRNSLRSFPVMENARRTSLNTGWVLSDCILADAFVLTENEPDGIYVQSVTISTHIVAVVIGSVRTGAAIGTASTVRGQDRQFASKPIHGLVAGVSGYITFGSALSNDRFVELRENAGMHLFSPSVMLEPRTVIDTGPFPVRSIGRGDRSLSGQIRLRTNSAMSFDVSQGSHNGDVMQIVSLRLTNPSAFLSPCEKATTPCECPTTPIHSINGVVPNPEGVIQVELVDENGTISLLAHDILSFLLTRTGEALCQRPAMPDDYGRLPSAAGYAADTKPTTPYQQEGDYTFPSPLL